MNGKLKTRRSLCIIVFAQKVTGVRFKNGSLNLYYLCCYIEFHCNSLPWSAVLVTTFLSSLCKNEMKSQNCMSSLKRRIEYFD